MAVDKSKKLEFGELDKVAGGNRLETYADGAELYKRGLLDQEVASSEDVRNKLHAMGYSGYKDKGGLLNDNIYKDKNGNTLTRDEFWAKFDKENGTKIIR